MTILTSTKGQTGLPRYFTAAFATISRLQRGRLDFRLPDGRVFRADGKKPGPIAELTVINPDVFARLVRDGDLGFCEAYLEGWWTTPDLQGFMDLVHIDNEAVYDGFPGFGLVRAYEMMRHWL
ncbi:MAG: SAM-dependent methyltransferase, partial [Paracoccaceae bacterium]